MALTWWQRWLNTRRHRHLRGNAWKREGRPGSDRGRQSCGRRSHGLVLDSSLYIHSVFSSHYAWQGAWFIILSFNCQQGYKDIWRKTHTKLNMVNLLRAIKFYEKMKRHRPNAKAKLLQISDQLVTYQKLHSLMQQVFFWVWKFTRLANNTCSLHLLNLI